MILDLVAWVILAGWPLGWITTNVRQLRHVVIRPSVAEIDYSEWATIPAFWRAVIWVLLNVAELWAALHLFTLRG